MADFSDDDTPRFLGRRIAPGLKIVAITIVSIVLMMVDNAHDSLSTVRGVLAVALEPVQMAAEIPGDAADYLKNYFDRDDLVHENEQLSQKLLLLQSRLQKLAALKAENERIRALLASASAIDRNVLIARILSVSPDPYRQYVKLNKGSVDGVFVGQTLIDAHGIMGQVTDVTPLTSRAILISDPNTGIPVQVNRTGLQTIAQGTGHTGALTLPFLPNNADIEVGDLLISSGLGGRYPPNYPVARVTRVVHRPGEEFLDVTAEPTANLNHGREVLLVWNNHGDGAQPASDHPGQSGKPAAPDDGSANDAKAP
ncbi:rod shape-determining protein MreC [Salinisphaera sp.]|uniref:rod shape-determining protein MreC n=1 Tax=Salinisphaera sp. TaxID=1914330 RepID=UPI002D78BA29|nr:rod shape-determining protein MreC [Salinisphaera sp.]HET7314248.1 rod shape-determining protein MreC [Salinisphaera sp.]